MTSDIASLTYADISLGDKASFSVVVDEKLVEEFGKLSGDTNPLHVDEAYARKTRFGARIAHGMIVGCLFSRFVGMHLPGKYSLYLSQTLSFRNPIFLGTAVVVRGEVTHKSDASKTLTIRLAATDASSKKIFVEGEAMVQVTQ